ncbi:hypothetical protein HZH68_006397 [Vespula germanica]|uniref:Uncharacterized protein n=1 Tax=Vespula germanica TaxID=30212 RepID=A0A834KBG2_VESGE|nr:hypothetical protein HZH68_006397 [Vespula germanica]
MKGVRWDGVEWGAVATRRESYDGYGTKEATVEPTGVEGRGWLEGVLEVWIHGLRSTASDVTRLVRKPTTTVTTTTTTITTTTTTTIFSAITAVPPPPVTSAPPPLLQSIPSIEYSSLA